MYVCVCSLQLWGPKLCSVLSILTPASVSPSVKTSIACGSFTHSTLFIGLDFSRVCETRQPCRRHRGEDDGRTLLCSRKSALLKRTGFAYHGVDFTVHADPVSFGKNRCQQVYRVLRVPQRSQMQRAGLSQTKSKYLYRKYPYKAGL